MSDNRKAAPRTPKGKAKSRSNAEIQAVVETAHVRFHALGAGGEAVGRDAAGRTIFAPLCAPDDEAKIEITSAHSRFARGRVQRFTQLSTRRVAPPCPYYQIEAEAAPQTGCGGCQWQHIEYSMQLEAKRELVVQALRRIGKIADAEEIVAPCVASPQAFSYRNKGDFVVESHNDERKIGFFAHSTHNVVDVARCSIQSDSNNLLLEIVRKAIERGLITAFDAATKSGLLQRFVARTASNGETLLLLFKSSQTWPQSGEFARFIEERAPQVVGVLCRSEDETEILSGRDWLEETVGGLQFRLTGDGFFQINTTATPLLFESAMKLAKPQGGDRVLDLYCGVGLFALGAARLGANVVGIEQSRHAIENARFNATKNDLQAEFFAGDVTAILQQRAAKNRAQPERFEIVFLDPPRAGAADCLAEIVRLEARRIVYVSCDAATLARDVRVLTGAGYALTKAIPLDLFPQTSHVETVALLIRADETV